MGEKLTPNGIVVGLIIEPSEEQKAPTEETVREPTTEAPKRTRQPKPKE